jgi:hypothetical protein
LFNVWARFRRSAPEAEACRGWIKPHGGWIKPHGGWIKPHSGLIVAFCLRKTPRLIDGVSKRGVLLAQQTPRDGDCPGEY